MNNNPNIISAFNKILIDIIDFISDYYNNTQEFVNHKTIIKTLIDSNPDKPITIFLIHIYNDDNLRYKIKHGDESILDKLPNEIDLLFNIKNKWNNLDIPSKNYIKKALLALTIVSEKYIKNITI